MMIAKSGLLRTVKPTMWHELIWNIDFLRGLIFVALGILAAVLLIPWILKRLQAQRENRVARALLKQWGHSCISAITALKPDTEAEQKTRLELLDSGDWDLRGYIGVEQIIDGLWEDIRNGKTEPDGLAREITNALEGVLYSDEERESKALPPEKRFPFPTNRAVLRSWLRRTLNPMYAKIEIFDVESLPIGELEMAMSYLDLFSEQGYFTRHQFISYALHLTHATEKFAKYFWKLENRSSKTKARNGG